MDSKKWMLLAVFSFCLLTISVKEISSDISSVQIIFFRSIIGLFFVSTLFYRKLPSITLRRIKKHLLRNVFHLIGQYGWIIGIIYLSLSEVTAIEFTAPIWVIIIAALFLKEKITNFKIIAIALALIGVLFILKPGVEIINFNSIIVLLSALSYSITHVITKKIVSTSSALEIVFIMCLIQTPISFLFALPQWTTPLLSDYIWFTLVAIAALTAHFSMARAFKTGNISDLIIIDYLRLPILVLIGILCYHDVFSYSLLMGAAFIIGGNYLNYRNS